MPRRLEDEYTVEDALGSGSYAEVYRCKHKQSGQYYAVKMISKAKAGPKGVKTTQNEVEILRSLSHQNVITLKDYFETNSFMYLVLEVVCGGELFDKIVELRHYSEQLAAKLARQLLETLRYLHANNICHRDLKPENLLLKTKLKASELERDGDGNVKIGDPKELLDVENILTNIKLVDFGFAVRTTPGTSNLTECCGTPNFIAPEILAYGIFKTNREGYNEKCDIWSTGVLMYILLCGYAPFHANNRSQMFKKIVEGRFTFHKNTVWDKISPEAKDFINQMLITAPDKRPTAEQALQHPWIHASQAREVHLQAALDELRNFNARQKFKGAIFGIEAANRVLYLQKCTGLGIKPNSQLAQQLPEANDRETELTVLDLNSNYLGAKGLQAALLTLADTDTCTHLRLRSNQIDHQAVTVLCECLKQQRSVTSVDLSDNPISQLSGRLLLSLLQNNNRLVEMKLEGTHIKPSFQKKIEAQLERNRAVTGKYTPQDS